MLAFSIARFEGAQRLRRASSAVYLVAFFAIALLLQLAAGGAFSSVSVGMGAGGKVFANSPYQLQIQLMLLTFFGMIVTAVVFGQAICQDFESNSYALFFTSPVRERSYLVGRFLGALGFVVLVHLALALGMFVAGHTPWVDHSQFAADRLSAYVWPYVSGVIPDLVLLGGLFFAIAATTRRMLPVYVTAVVLFMAWLASGSLMSKLEHRTLAAMLDPLGLRALDETLRYASVAEKNTRLVPLSGVFLGNRVLWAGVGLAALGVALVRFRYSELQRRAGSTETIDEQGPLVATTSLALGTSSFAHVLRTARLGFVEVVRQPHFAVIVLAAALFSLIAASQSGVIFDTNVYPVTHTVLSVTTGTFGLFSLVIGTIYAGELVWRERDARVDQLADTMPTKTWVPLVGKLLALFMVQAVLVLVVALCGVAFQTAKGYFHYELAQYAKELLGIQLLRYCIFAAFAIAVHALVNQKPVAHLVIVLYYIARSFFGRFGLEHNLWKFGATPTHVYSDMNHYGHLVAPVLWFDLHWAVGALLLCLAASVFWTRGTALTWRVRLAVARRRFTGVTRIASVLALVAFACTGSFIYYNTNVLNRFESEVSVEKRTADYERRWKSTATDPQPRIVGVDLAVDIEPEHLTWRASGSYRLVNKTSQPVTKVYVNVDREADAKKLEISGRAASSSDRDAGVYTIELAQPMAPGGTATLDVQLEHVTRGFRNEDQPTSIVDNGTFISSGELVTIGYQEGAELSDEESRKKMKLPPKERMHALEDTSARRNNYISSDTDWMDFAMTVSTAPDQIALAPGYLEKEWSANGRRYFRYEMGDTKILGFFSVLSARYAVKRDKWNDVALEINYHPGHEYNLDAMMKGMKASLDYYTSKFGPYQHRQVRILEFPLYQQFAQSFPNTIPYSESIGFIAKVDPNDEHDVDYPLYVTAHEIAHQWWAHQVIGANVQGATMLSETLSQYSALMVMKKTYGAEKMRRFLRLELDRYLQGRSLERKKELPVERNENQQYIHYNKGSLVMYALQDYLGEDVVDRVLSEYLAAVKFQEPPYTVSLELVERFRAAAPAELKYIIEDLFDTITIYDNRAIDAQVKKNGDKYDVTLTLSAKKLRAGELGAETEVKLDDLVDIGALDDKGQALFLEKRRVHAGEQVVTFTLDRMPAKVGVDPLNKLIDRIPDDNAIALR